MPSVAKQSKKKYFLVTLIFMFVAGGVYYWWQMGELKWKDISAGTLTFLKTSIVVEVANTPELRRLGLGGRDTLDEKTGMLFIFDTYSQPELWMKDMKFAIDIIFFDRNFNVVDIKENFRPESYPEVYISKEKAKYAVEVKSGFLKQYEITPGNKAEFEAY